jgi:hypothetical protein
MRLIQLPQVVLNTAFALGALALTATVAHAETGIDSTPTPSSAGSLPPPSSAPVVVPPPAAPPPAAMAPVPAPADGTTHVEVDVPSGAPTTTPAVPPPKAADVPDYNAAATTNANIQSVPVEPLPPLTPPGYSTAHPYTPNKIGGALLVGGGYEDFTNSTVNQMTSGGGAWNARVVAGTRQFVGLEAAYVGAARSIDALGLSQDATLISNGVEGNVRVNIPIIRRASMVEPFGFVGLGWSHYHVGNTETRTSDVATNDDVMTVPLGAGLEYSYKAFIADARFTYRPTYYNDLLRTGGGNLNNWGVGGQIGFSY